MWQLVYGPRFHQLYSPCLLFCLFFFPPPLHSFRMSWIWNQKWLVLQPVHSAAQSSPNIKDAAPGYKGLFVYSPHVLPEQSSLNLVLIVVTLFWDSHLNGRRKILTWLFNLQPHQTNLNFKLRHLHKSASWSRSGSTCWAYYTCTTHSVFFFFYKVPSGLK